jgi:hypothetical protein
MTDCGVSGLRDHDENFHFNVNTLFLSMMVISSNHILVGGAIDIAMGVNDGKFIEK